MATTFYAQPATVNVFERGRRSRRPWWRIQRRPAVGYDISPCGKHRGDLVQRCPAFATGCHGGIMHVLPKSKSLGTKQGLQTIFGLIFINGHKLLSLSSRNYPLAANRTRSKHLVVYFSCPPVKKRQWNACDSKFWFDIKGVI